ncbi:MAG: phosphoribosylformylglycinamidine synthase [Verrucomicrobia bacterium]|nr:phosphoribosylformylglycinamidine synthase [Verrucomicrobiota bacterium]
MQQQTHRIEVALKAGVRDAPGEGVRHKVAEHLGIELAGVRVVEVYTIVGDLTAYELEQVQAELFTDPVIQVSSLGKPLAKECDYFIEVGFRPGVTDNVGRTSVAGIRDVLPGAAERPIEVYTSKQYLLEGCTSAADAERIASGLLANDLIQRWRVLSAAEYATLDAPPLSVPKVELAHEPQVRTIDLEVSDDELLRISTEGILALTLDEMKAIQAYYRRPDVIAKRKVLGLGAQPTDVELECLAQTWSEHCKHKIFNAVIEYREDGRVETINSLFKTYVRGSTEEIAQKIDWLVSIFHDNAGIIKFADEWNLVVKVETHNSPSALDPYGGALTGIVGVNRDPAGTGLGSKLIFNTDVFCFGPPDYEGEIPPRLLHPKRIFDGVRMGVEHGGNKSGIPTVNGAILFDERFIGKPLVFCGTGGLIPSRVGEADAAVKVATPGDAIVMVGGRIGKDGIHGATFSSVEIDEKSPTSAVQIGDPITQKVMLDFLLEARDLGLYTLITDNGAGGLSSSIGETAQLSGGAEIELAHAPLKYGGLDPWEIFVSEAQERMTVGVPAATRDAFLALAKRRGVEATVLGTYTDSGLLHVTYHGESVGSIDMDFLHDGCPTLHLKATWTPPKLNEPEIETKKDHTDTLLAMLGRLNVCSKEPVIRQYDHEVQSMSVVKPLCGVANDGPADAAVLRPLYGSDAGIAVACGINPSYGDIDTYHMVACVIDEAVRNVIAVGAKPGTIAGLDNFCWPDPVQSPKTPDGEHKLAQLVRACRALYDYTVAYGVPCISGKDSMKNDYKLGEWAISIPPTMLFTAVGRVPNVRCAVTSDAKADGDVVYVLGVTRNELGGSQYYAHYGAVGRSVPKVEALKALKLYTALAHAIERGLVRSCHDCSDGGLGVALAETAFAGGLGMKIELQRVPNDNVTREDFLLFSESQSRFVVTVEPCHMHSFEMTLSGLPFARIGTVNAEPRLVIKGFGVRPIVNAAIGDLKEAWQAPLRGVV